MKSGPTIIQMQASALIWLLFAGQSSVGQVPPRFKPDIPRTWEDGAIASLEVPLANPIGSPKHVSADYYYQIPVRPIYKHKFGPEAARGENLFAREGCSSCHTAPLYTNNKLTPVDGFTIPQGHLTKYEILPMSVGTDPGLALQTRRGTGYYKIPSLKGVWYRNMFGHSGWCATLEDWFDPTRTHDSYVPTGFKPYGRDTYAVKGHLFGLDLTPEEKKDLIAFLKTL